MAFPNVPNAPGVPAVPRDVLGAAIDAVQLLAADALSLFPGLEPAQWGLFLDGAPAVTAESCVSFEFRKGYTIASFQVEEGGFESYDKVQRPFDIRLRFSTGATLADRQAMEASFDAVVSSLQLFDAVTPLKTYLSVNPVNYNYRQTADRGVGLLVIDLFCEQVRVTAKSSFTNAQQTGAVGTPSSGGSTGTGTITITPVSSIVAPQSPSASPRVSDGTVQAVPVAAGQFDLSQALP